MANRAQQRGYQTEIIGADHTGGDQESERRLVSATFDIFYPMLIALVFVAFGATFFAGGSKTGKAIMASLETSIAAHWNGHKKDNAPGEADYSNLAVPQPVIDLTQFASDGDIHVAAQAKPVSHANAPIASSAAAAPLTTASISEPEETNAPLPIHARHSPRALTELGLRLNMDSQAGR